MIRHGTKVFKLIFATLITLICFTTIWMTTWESSDVNHSGATTVLKCIYNDEKRMQFALDAGGGNNYHVSMVENSKQNCFNPYFPSIRIQASQPHNAWIHIVYTDSKAPQ